VTKLRDLLGKAALALVFIGVAESQPTPSTALRVAIVPAAWMR
jgi:hypothetical protein